MKFSQYTFKRTFGYLPIAIGLIMTGYATGQDNLLDYSTWTEGSGSAPGFTRIGANAENIRLLGESPFGNQEILWQCTPDTADNNDGGWNSAFQNVDAGKTYRMTVWIKRTNSQNGRSVFGVQARNASNAWSTTRLDGTAVNAINFFLGDLEELDKWYLLVGYIHPANADVPVSNGGIYDPVTGLKVRNLTDCRMTLETNRIRHRAYFQKTVNPQDLQLQFAPTIYEMNGQEPTIDELLGRDSNGGNSPWTQSGSNTYVESGNVGIGTSSPSANLDVAGTLKTGSLASGSKEIYTEPDTRGNHRGSGTQSADGLVWRIKQNPAPGGPIFQVRSSGQAVRLFVEHDGYTGAKDNSAWFSGTKFPNYFKNEVGIGTETVPAGYQLAVEGKIRTREVRVDMDDWPDYVFDKNYDLPSLEEVERYIYEYGHLKKMPSAKIAENEGIVLGEMNKRLLEKIEELTLYLIQQNHKIKTLESKIETLIENNR